MQKIKESIKSINYKLFWHYCLWGYTHGIYNRKNFYLGQLPGDWGYNIASQLSWVNLLYEIIQEAIILPLFFLLESL